MKINSLEDVHCVRDAETATLQGQQKFVDTFADLKFIPKLLKVIEAAWKVGE